MHGNADDAFKDLDQAICILFLLLVLDELVPKDVRKKVEPYCVGAALEEPVCSDISQGVRDRLAKSVARAGLKKLWTMGGAFLTNGFWRCELDALRCTAQLVWSSIFLLRT